MADNNRGVIENRQYANQVKDYSGLRYGKITPTDIDGVIDFGNKVFVFIELKYGEHGMKIGQRLAIQRLVDNLNSRGWPSIGIVARHDCPPNTDINVASCQVEEVRFGKDWHKLSDFDKLWGRLSDENNVRRVIDRFLLKYAPDEMQR